MFFQRVGQHRRVGQRAEVLDEGEAVGKVVGNAKARWPLDQLPVKTSGEQQDPPCPEDAVEADSPSLLDVLFRHALLDHLHWFAQVGDARHAARVAGIPPCQYRVPVTLKADLPHATRTDADPSPGSSVLDGFAVDELPLIIDNLEGDQGAISACYFR